MLSAHETRQLDRLTIRAATSASPAAASTLRHVTAAGHGIDFHDFRHYEPGDDPRRIDWTIAARHRQLVVRQFRAEGHVRLHLLVDVSRSMTLGAPPKMDCAIKLASALGYVAAERGDAVGTATFDDRLVARVPPAAGRPQLFRVLDALDNARAGRASQIDRALRQYGGIVRGPGLVVVLSDFLQPDLTLEGVLFLQYRGLTPALVHVMSDDELGPEFGDDEAIEFTDIERPGAQSVIADRRGLAVYQRQLSALTRRLSQFCATRGLPSLRVTSSTPFDRVLGACVQAGLLATAT